MSDELKMLDNELRDILARCLQQADYSDTDLSDAERRKAVRFLAGYAAPAAPAVQEPVFWMDANNFAEALRQQTGSFLRYVTKTPMDSDIALYAAPVPAIPPGYRLVPIEPTEEMLKAATADSPGHTGTWANMNPPPKHTYKAMLAAAPQSTVPHELK